VPIEQLAETGTLQFVVGVLRNLIGPTPARIANRRDANVAGIQRAQPRGTKVLNKTLCRGDAWIGRDASDRTRVPHWQLANVLLRRETVRHQAALRGRKAEPRQLNEGTRPMLDAEIEHAGLPLEFL
jgi:hypothetical protein